MHLHPALETINENLMIFIQYVVYSNLWFFLEEYLPAKFSKIGAVLDGRVGYLKIHFIFVINQGPVVQSTVSLTSSLRNKFVKCFTIL